METENHQPMEAASHLPNIEKSMEEIKNSARYQYGIRPKVQISSEILPFETYLKFFSQYASHEIVKQGGDWGFNIDTYNERIIEQLFFYITGDDRFNGSFEKGLLLAGYYGSGKTILLKALRLTVNYWLNWLQKTKSEFFIPKDAEMKVINDSPVRFFKSVDLVKAIIELKGEIPEAYKRTNEFMIIDELGYEPNESNIFGTRFMPITDLLRERYDRGLITWATTNLNIDDLGNHYGELAKSRIKSMFNFIEVNGLDRRNSKLK